LGGLSDIGRAVGTYTLTLAASGTAITDAVGNPLQGGASDSWTVSRPSMVQEVFVRGSGWSDAFKTYLQDKGLGDGVMGYRLFGAGRAAPAAGSDDVLPWINLDQIVVRFTAEPWVSDLAHLPGAFNVAGLNGGRSVQRYPGSPWLIAQALRTADRYLACELRPDEHEHLRGVLRGRQNVRTLCQDGYAAAVAECPREGRVLVLIDPPFEQPDDYRRIVETLAAVRRRNRQAQALVWLPLKDLETFDAFLRDLEDAVAAPALVAETRMRPLTDPMKMNGCALVAIGAPPALEADMEAVLHY